jgi:alginate O-acetyltransferase complex protein AlgI
MLAICYAGLPQKFRVFLPIWAFSTLILLHSFPYEIPILVCVFMLFYFAQKTHAKHMIWILLIIILCCDKLLTLFDSELKVTGLSFFAITASILFWKNKSTSQILDMSFFFPHVAAGPIIFDQIHDTRDYYTRLTESMLKFLIGVAMLEMSSVLLHRIGSYRDIAQLFNPIEIGFFYLPALFSNFFGYSLVATAYATILGINITFNFNGPGIAHNSRDFWERWHISLSTFMKNYLFEFLRTKYPKYLPLCIILTFLISGVWHGIGFGYFIWSLFFGLLAVFYPKKLKKNALTVSGWYLVSLSAWSFFYYHDVELSWLIQNFSLMEFAASYEIFGMKALCYLIIVYIIYLLPTAVIFRIFGEVQITYVEIPIINIQIPFYKLLFIALLFGIFMSEQVGVGTEFIYAEF